MSTKGDGVYEGYYKPHLNPHQSQAANRQNLYESMYQRILMELCTNRFKWRGLPETVDERFLELELMRRGLTIMYHDEAYGFLVARGTPARGYNMYDNPLAYTLSGNRFIHGQVDAAQCVPIWSNYLRQPDWDIITLYASRLAEMERTREITAKNMRQTRMIIASEETRLSMANVQKQIESGQAVIYGAPAMDPQAITAVDMQIHPETLPKMAIDRSQVWNDCMTLLGINNANQDKRERLVADEVEANDEQISTFKHVALNARKQAAEEMSAKWDLDVSVNFAKPEDMHRQIGSVDTEAEAMARLLAEGESGE